MMKYAHVCVFVYNEGYGESFVLRFSPPTLLCEHDVCGYPSFHVNAVAYQGGLLREMMSIKDKVKQKQLSGYLFLASLSF